jgi:Zn-dependent protease with chaperone function
MRREHILAWLPLSGFAACSLLMSPSVPGRSCPHLLWHCTERSLVLNLLTLTILSPLLFGVGIGLWAGVSQINRTQQAIKRLRRLPHNTLPAPAAALVNTLHILGRLDVVNDAEATAFCYGWLRPRICVTTSLLNSLTLEEVEAVLQHERHHLQQRDPLRSLLWTILDGACWWTENVREQAQLQCELAADRAVIAAGGRQALASALLKLISSPQGSPRNNGLALSGISVTEARIDQLLQPNRVSSPSTSFSLRHIAPIASAIAMVLCVVVLAR